MTNVSLIIQARSTILLSCALYCWSSISTAQVVQPMRYNLQPSGEDAHKTITVENNKDSNLIIEITASLIDFNIDGKEIHIPADDEFVIFPPTAIIQPGNLQAIRVQYVGEPDIHSSKSYRIAVKQIPIDLSNLDQNTVAVAVNFNTLAHVIPSNADASPVVEKIEEDSSGQFWNVIINNKGNRYFAFTKSAFALEDSSGKSVTLEGESLTNLIGKGMMLPNSIRTFKMTRPEGFVAVDSRIKISVLE